LRNFAILGAKAKMMLPEGAMIDTIVMNDVPVTCGIVETSDPAFDREKAGGEHDVLIRVKAFSLNYRDKNRIFSMMIKGVDTGFYVVGSEFVAEVLAIGPAVSGVAVGDRVIGNNSYPKADVEGVAPGVPSNHASKEMQILHETKLIKIPDSMTNATAAAFSIGAQTTYSMVRRLEIFDGAKVLVTAAKSNTSLFAIQALRQRNVNVFAISTSNSFSAELESMGVKELIVVDPECETFAAHPVIGPLVTRIGGFDFVIDPYFDLHLSRSIDVMAVGAKYITCGLYDQYLEMIHQQRPRSYRTNRELISVMIKNLHIIGNCIGLTSDLQAALDDYDRGTLKVAVDSVYSGREVGAFLDRTYNARDRFGKVIYQYD
jgi:NADPH:quinone reductase-like Zn-dependent oxidoreductase